MIRRGDESGRVGRRVPGVVRGAALLALLLACLPASVARAAGAADANTVLLLDTSVAGGSTSLEATTAAGQGFTVEVADATAWAAKTAADFATYRAIILGDAGCVTDTSPYQAALANKAVWGAAVTGNVLVTGNDPTIHAAQGGGTLIANGILFATAQPAKTGALIALGCAYGTADPGTAVPLLDAFASGGFAASGLGCFNTAHVVASHPALAGLTDTLLSNWDCSAREGFDRWPADFIVVAIVDNANTSFVASDGSVGSPYILGRGDQLAVRGLSVAPVSARAPVGTVHSVTVQLRATDTGAPVADEPIVVKVTAGPNLGAVGICAPSSCRTDSGGNVSFSYTGSGGLGEDSIIAFHDINGDSTPEAGEGTGVAAVQWVLCGDGIVQPDEQCDPAAATSSCPANLACLRTCVCGCLSDANCDDGNACNGVETCNTNTNQCQAGTPIVCDNGNLCDGVETCDPSTGSCLAGTDEDAGTLCEADANLCTIDQCDGSGSCVNAGNAQSGTQCDDGLFCDGTEQCDSAGHCLSSGDPCPGTMCNATCQEATQTCFDPAGTTCNDSDAGTLSDVCDGAGACGGHPVVDQFALLRWPSVATQAEAVFGWRVDIGGNVCVDGITARQFSQVEGSAIVPKAVGTAMQFTFANKVSGRLVTAGGRVLGKHNVTSNGPPDTSGHAPELDDCAAAGIRASTRRAQLHSLPATTGFNLNALRVPRSRVRSVFVADPAGGSRVVIKLTDLRVGEFSKLILVGRGNTQEVVVLDSGPLRLAPHAEITLENLLPEQVIFVVDGPITTKGFAGVKGTLFGGDVARIGWRSNIDGALLAHKGIRLFQWVTIKHSPFIDW